MITRPVVVGSAAATFAASLATLDALGECDPVARGHRDQFAWSLLYALNRQQPAIDAGVSACRHQAGLELTVRVIGTKLTWFTDALARRADGDAERAAALVAADLPPRLSIAIRSRSPRGRGCSRGMRLDACAVR